MNHCSALPETCTPPPLPASGPRTLLKSTRPLSASPPARSCRRAPAFQLQPHVSRCVFPSSYLSAPLLIPSPQIPVHIPLMCSHPHSTVQDQMYPSYAHQLPLSHCSCPEITIPSPHTWLHISVYQPPTQLLATLLLCPPCPSDSPPLPSPSPHCPRPSRSPRSPRFTRSYTASPLRSRELRSHYDN
jgi:hypothetical protein